MKTYAYGFPRIGRNREYKKLIESFWKGTTNEAGLESGLAELQESMAETYDAYVDGFPVGELTAYDAMLDTAVMCGLYDPKGAEEYYAICRGKNALDMTKWFNTNYHYLVPDFTGKKTEDLRAVPGRLGKLVKSFPGKPVSLIGPFTFLKLSKGISPEDRDAFADRIAEIYSRVLEKLGKVHLHEPAFVLELTEGEIASIETIYEELGTTSCSISVFTYYDSVDFLPRLFDLPVAGIGLDFVHGPANLDHILANGFPPGKTLYAGLIDGRNVWRTDLQAAVDILKKLADKAGDLIVTNASPLYHLPVTVEGEDFDPALRARLSFAVEKLAELRDLALAFQSGQGTSGPHAEDDGYGRNDAVRARTAGLGAADFARADAYGDRRKVQDRELGLPVLATTTIGSFPQTPDVRKARADFTAGRISETEYREFVNSRIRDAVERQERLGLDVFVHGEFERSDMVEFFAEKLDGIATTRNGWILSYGTRGYRPPIIYGDVSRPAPMTVREIAYAKSLTEKPMKGMLTGPVTIIAWSFVRNDIPVSDAAYQIGLALRDEITDYEKAGIRIVQVDEPAFRELAPNKRSAWSGYFDWAVKAFRLTTGGAAAGTQIHTHMCYSEFGEIIDRIHAMDFDVISIEAARSRGQVIESFENADFDRQIGLGVWDIHSPVVPAEEEIERVVERALKTIPLANFWINPDCGLKTRGWEESMPSLARMIEAAARIRERHVT